MLTRSRKSLTDEFNRVSIAVLDMAEALVFAAEAEEPQKPLVREALLQAAIVAYARPFLRSNTSDQSTARVSIKRLSGLTRDERALHRDVLTLRNEAVAHSDFVRNAVTQVRIEHPSFSVSIDRSSVAAALGNHAKFRELTIHVYTLLNQFRTRLTAEIGAHDA